MKKYLLCSLMLMALPVTGLAGNASTNLPATANIPSACTIATTQNIMFGTYDPVGIHASLGPAAQGQVTVNCTKGSYNLTVSSGVNAGFPEYFGSYPAPWQGAGYFYRQYRCNRKMSNGSQTVGYELFSDASMTTVSYNQQQALNAGGETAVNCNIQNSSTVQTFRTLSFTSAGSQVVDLYARVLPGTQNAAALPGVYSDTLSVSISF